MVAPLCLQLTVENLTHPNSDGRQIVTSVIAWTFNLEGGSGRGALTFGPDGTASAIDTLR